MDSLKVFLHNNPGQSLLGTISGYAIYFIEILNPILSFMILLASTITAVSLSYIQYKKATSYVKKTSKKSNRNSR